MIPAASPARVSLLEAARRALLAALAAAALPAQRVPLLAEDRLRLPEGLAPAVDVCLADLDLDGDLDLLRLGSESLDVLLQASTGEFVRHPLQQALVFAGADLRSVAVGRLGPGSIFPDVVLGRALAAPLLLSNDGTGRLVLSTVPLPSPPLPVAGVLVGDLDGVPPDDMLVLPDQGRPQLLLGQATSGYRDASHLLPANLFVQAPVALLADLDGDGDLDVVLASRTGGVPFVLDNNAGFLRQIALPFNGACSALAAGDFDGDRRVDLVLARAAPAPGAVEFALNRGTGFVAYAPTVPFPLDAAVASLATADLMLDGTVDLVLLQDDGRVRVGVNDGQLAFAFRHPLPILADAAPRAGLALGDLEGDGDVDLVVAGGLRGGVAVRDSVLLGRAVGADFLDTEAIGFPIGLFPGAGAGAAVDFDGDGELDVVAYGPLGVGRAFRNDGAARFAVAPGVLPALSLRDVRRVAVASLDTAQRDLLIVATPAGGTAQPPGVRLLVAQSGRYVDASGRLPPAFRGGFADVVAARVLQPTGTRTVDDLVVADNAGNLAVLANTGGGLAELTGAFSPGTSTDPVRAVVTGDVDGDGLADVVVLTYGNLNGGGMQVFLRTRGNAPPLFVEAPRPPLVTAAVTRALLDDFDGDGDADVLVTLDSNAASALRLFAGDGRGGFHDATGVAFTPPLPGRVDAVAVLRRPAQEPALLLGRVDGAPLAVLRRQGGRFAAAEEQTVHGSPRSSDLVVGDFDTDGDDDCAVLPVDASPGLLLGTDLQFAARGVAQGGREMGLRARGPDPAAIAAWLWSPAGAARLPFPDLGIVRLAPPVVSLAVFPFGPAQTLDLTFAAPTVRTDTVLSFQLAVFDPRTTRMRLSNLAPVLLTAR
ncbi:MAG: VCBS repeat-containing protein [Planctomycetota bacterium]